MSDHTFLCNGQATQYQNWLHMADVARPKKVVQKRSQATDFFRRFNFLVCVN